jgi:actin-related protein
VHSLEEALVVDIGAECTYISPVSEGLLLKDYLIKSHIGSKYLNQGLKNALNSRRKDYLGLNYL